MLPTFVWSASSDPDPQDSVRYVLKLALDEGFSFVSTRDSVFDTSFAWPDSLDFAENYWWKVEAHDQNGAVTNSVVHFNSTWVLGDANGDGSTNIGDVTFLIAMIFSGGASPAPLKVGDVNADCSVNIADVTSLISFIFSGGSAPGVGCAEMSSP